MDIIDPGHKYHLRILDAKISLTPHVLVFVKREGDGYPGNIGHHSGTTTQEVLRALIDRTKYVDNQIHDPRNDHVLAYLRRSIYKFEERAAERHGRVLILPEGLKHIESLPVCEKCGHIGCEGECH